VVPGAVVLVAEEHAPRIKLAMITSEVKYNKRLLIFLLQEIDKIGSLLKTMNC
jgi:hypothetical protein